jgi:hypothetical protein
MKEFEFEDMETPEVRFTKLMKDYTTLKQHRLILMHGILDSVQGHSEYPPPLDETTIYLLDIESIERFAIDGYTPPTLKQKIWRSMQRLEHLLLQVNTYWLKQAITQLYAIGADGNLNLNHLTEFTTYEKELQAEQLEAQLVQKMIKPRGET